MQIIPLDSVASQQISATLNSQDCTINVYQKSTGLYVDVYLSGTALIVGRLCRDRGLIIRQAYLGFVGDLSFMDTEGSSDPDYTGLGSRYQLMYLLPSEV